ncbi:unnamed protein product [Paramecium pentaurelia]|uniref:Uncharacterized protein n=1 Tax=Paramecium pentaurelia TaxID=43138 RepID=A0A8S1Y1D9_9CILI|nr:unnamed protein product [Paramecium pentaurelia]
MQRYYESDRLSQLSQPTKRSQKYTQNQSLMVMSRLCDNHFDKDIHEKPWISLGIFRYDRMIKYEHSDAGLSYTNVKIKKLRTFQELWEKNEEIHNKSEQHQGFREFREFKDISEEDVIVTIEYCTNCHEHMGSTKHDEARYLTYAQALKNEIIQRFPIVKVILKPLIYDHFDHSIDTMFLQRRLGCFEVQVMSKQKGQIKQAVIGSKLNTKAWPQTSVIINKLPQYFKKVSFNIDLKFADSDQKLKNIDVKIQPYRPVQSRSQSIMLTSRSNRMLRPQSAQTRPKSAYSNISGQSQRSLKEPVENPSYKIERTNQDGRISLKNVPLDVYEVIIEETNDFLRKTQQINLFQLNADDQPLDQVINLEKQTHSCIIVTAVCQMAPVTECKVEIIPMRGGKDAVLKESPPGSGKYEIVVEPDQFNIFVKKIGYIVYKGQISPKAGVCEFKFELIKANTQEEGYDPVQDALDKKHAIKPSSDLMIKKPKYLQPPSVHQDKINLIQFQFIDLVSKYPVPNVYIKVHDETNNKLYSYRSNENGICKALLQTNIIKGRIFIQHVEYYEETKEINEQHPLSTTSINHYHIIHKPQQSQLVVLLVNKPNQGFLNFYIILENKQVIQSDSDIQQYQNPKDGIQLISFSNLQNKRDILQLVACLPKLKMDSIEEMCVLTPNSIERYQLPQLPQEQGTLYPYFWILGSLKEPYEAFDVVNQIINTSQLKTYPNLTKSHKNPQEVAQCAFQSPNLIVAANQNGSVSIWNLDSYLIDSTINCKFSDHVNTIIIWDDENVMISDNSGLVVWLKKDDDTQQFILVYTLAINKKTNSMCKVGAEGLALGTNDGELILVKVDLRQLQLYIDTAIQVESSTQTVDPINKMVSITNDQIAFLCDNNKSIFIYKIEKSLDKPLSGTLIKQVIIKGYLSGGQPILQIISIDQRYLIFGGLDGVLHTLSIDSLERGPNISLHSNQQVNSVLSNEDGVLIAQGNHISFVYGLETINELKITNQKYFQSPVMVYQGECVTYEKRLLTFTKQGRLVVWSLQDKLFPDISNFLLDTEFPHKLKPIDRQYLLVDAKISKENFSIYLIKENGEIIKDSTKLIKFEREDTYFYMEIDQTQQQGLWRLGAYLQNTELIRSKQPKIYFISSHGYQVLNFPQQIPISKKQAYHWLIGTLIPHVDTLKSTSLYTDSQIVGKFPSLEMSKHEGKINQIVFLYKDEFITAGEDKQVIIWNAQTFEINKVLYHEAEVLSVYVHNGMLLAGNKEGTVIGWKQHDGIWQMDIKFKHHEKGVYSIVYVDGSIVTASEDRKIQLVNFVSGALEHVEPVDRTFVISLVTYNKDVFAAGFPDGRVKTYKREKTGPKIILKTLRTVVTVKVQHLYMINNNLLFVGGMDKVSDLMNVEQGTKLKTLKDGHTGSILCSLLYFKHLITGGSDGRLSIWNFDKGLLIKTYELTKEEIRGVFIIGRLLITASSNGMIRIWQEICPFIEQIPPEEEPEQQQQQQLQQ